MQVEWWAKGCEIIHKPVAPDQSRRGGLGSRPLVLRMYSA